LTLGAGPEYKGPPEGSAPRPHDGGAAATAEEGAIVDNDHTFSLFGTCTIP
jgi:hypothetical protein